MFLEAGCMVSAVRRWRQGKLAASPGVARRGPGWVDSSGASMSWMSPTPHTSWTRHNQRWCLRGKILQRNPVQSEPLPPLTYLNLRSSAPPASSWGAWATLVLSIWLWWGRRLASCRTAIVSLLPYATGRPAEPVSLSGSPKESLWTTWSSSRRQ